jgi:hypothetical protein
VLKYLAVSTVIVLGITILVAAWVNRDLIRIKVASVYARIAAKPGAGDRIQAATAPLSGDAPWALSALPECLTQISKSTGSEHYVRAHLPARAARIVPPRRLVFGDCAIAIDNDAALVRRGPDRLRIPPPVQFYRAPGLFAMIRETAQGAELRVYQPARP